MTTYTKGIPGELPEIRDFINMVFSMHKSPHNFESLIPKLYADGQKTEGLHYLVKEDGKIKAVVCALPFTLIHGCLSLSCAAIGSVSVHPYSRKKGYMKELMDWMQKDLKQQGVTLSVLAGRRNRYQYFGYEPGGQTLEFQLISDNFRHLASKFPEYPISLQPVDSLDTNLISQCCQIYKTQTMYADREETAFFQICRSFECQLYAIWTKDHLSGYLCAAHGRIYELVLEKEDLLFSCLKYFLEYFQAETLTLSAPSWQVQRIRFLTSFCERFSISQEGNFSILDYKAAISFFLNLKAKELLLSDGCVVLKLGDQCPLRITVSKNQVSLMEVTESSCLELNSLEAVNLLFSPGAFLPGSPPALLSSVNWFPLPLSLSPLDKC